MTQLYQSNPDLLKTPQPSKQCHKLGTKVLGIMRTNERDIAEFHFSKNQDNIKILLS